MLLSGSVAKLGRVCGGRGIKPSPPPVTTSALGAYGQLLPTATKCDYTSANARDYDESVVVPQLLLVTGVHQDYSSTASAHPRCGGRGTSRRAKLTDIILFVLLLTSGLVPAGADGHCLRVVDGDVAPAALHAPAVPHGILWANVVPLWLDLVPGDVCLYDVDANSCPLLLLCDEWYGDALHDWNGYDDVLKLSWPGAASQPRPPNTKASSLFLENRLCCPSFRLNALPCVHSVCDGVLLSLVECVTGTCSYGE